MKGKRFDPRWSNEKSALIGFYVGRGRLAPAIASILRDGTDGATIRTMIERWGLPRGAKRIATVPIELDAKRRILLHREANRRGCKPEDLLRKIAEAVIDDGIYGAVIDDEKPGKAPDSSVA